MNIDLDRQLRDGLMGDYQIFDNKRPIRITHTSSNGPTLDFDTGILTSTKEEYLVCVALFRQRATRSAQSVRSVRDRTMPVQIEFFNKHDVVIEVPIEIGAKVRDGDVIEDLTTNLKWKVTAFDNSTLDSRIRIGCSTMA
jgi:hypothetical protein